MHVTLPHESVVTIVHEISLVPRWRFILTCLLATPCAVPYAQPLWAGSRLADCCD